VEREEAIEQRAASAARSVPTSPAVDNSPPDDGDTWEPPQEDYRDLTEWECLLDCLACRILWDDDFNMAEYFMDGDPDESRVLMERMGIADEYFTAIAPDPTEKELGVIREQLRKLCGRRKSRRLRP
jgi:hypothetical protein